MPPVCRGWNCSNGESAAYANTVLGHAHAKFSSNDAYRAGNGIDGVCDHRSDAPTISISDIQCPKTSVLHVSSNDKEGGNRRPIHKRESKDVRQKDQICGNVRGRTWKQGLQSACLLCGLLKALT